MKGCETVIWAEISYNKYSYPFDFQTEDNDKKNIYDLTEFNLNLEDLDDNNELGSEEEN